MDPGIVKLLSIGKVGVMPTDTVYGIVGSALNPQTVEEIYKLRKRAKDKPMIVLISGISDLAKFDIKISKYTEEALKKIWPNPVSVVLPCPSEKFTYLHRGKKTLAFRLPKDKRLMDLLKETGPLVAPSANVEGQPVAETIQDAKKVFGAGASFYVDGGKLALKASTVIRLHQDGTRIVLREGSFKV